MKSIYNKILIFLLLLLTFQSCKKFVEIDPPNNQLISETIFATDETATSALTGIYSQMVNDNSLPYTLALYTGMAADELKNYSNDPNVMNVYSNSINAQSKGPTDNIWRTAYGQIYQANAVWEGCEASATLSSEVKKHLMAESKFIRAWWYFYLVNLYGDVPLIITTDYASNATMARTPATKVYEQIVADLTYSETELNPSYVGLNSTTITTDRVRPNSFAASALLARVYLYLGQYKLAEDESTKIVANTVTYQLESTDMVFLKESKEAIWEIMMPSPYVNNNANTQEAANFVLTANPGTISNLSQIGVLSDEFLASFEKNDLRKTKWVSVFMDASSNPAMNYYYPYKYKLPNSPTSTEYTMPLRLSEQYLIRAEARLKQGNLGGAKDDLNALRIHSGLGESKADSEQSILDAVFHERRIELFGEWGHRWLDLKRSGRADSVMVQITPIKGGVWQSFKKTWPIPVQEILNNKNLIQNEGYK